MSGFWSYPPTDCLVKQRIFFFFFLTALEKMSFFIFCEILKGRLFFSPLSLSKSLCVTYLWQLVKVGLSLLKKDNK